MPQEYRYPLTRVCLRHGALTLPRTMLELFPGAGEVTAVDTLSNEAFDLTILGPRSVGGFAAFFESHALEVNDELLIRPLEDGRFAITPMSRHKAAADYGRQQAVRALLDELAEANVPVTEVEIRALYPDIPEALDLRSALVADGRFVHHDGRWQLETTLLERAQAEAAELEGRAEPRSGAFDGEEVEAVGVADLGPIAAHGASAAATFEDDAAASFVGDAGAAEWARQPEALDPDGGTYGIGAPAYERDTDAAGLGEDAARSGEQAALWTAGSAPAPSRLVPPPSPAPHTAPPQAPGTAGGGATGAGEAVGSGPAAGPRGASRGSFFPEETAAKRRSPLDDDEPDLELVGRAREALGAFGYRVESLGQGQLLAHAELGRRQHTVLVTALGYGRRLDWAAVLARRRETGARYLAVFGDYRDLHRLQGPADLARATLWSWDGVERARGLSRAMPVSPHDLEPYFEQGGLFDQGLERFEKAMAGRVAERGEFSEVLTRLAGLRAPCVFLLEDLAGDGGLSRDHVLKVLERLAEAPFHLVARVDQGEFCLRQSVGPALENLVSYARSLQSRLPNRTRARVTGLGDPGAPFEEGALAGDPTAGDADDGLAAASAPADEAGAADGAPEATDPRSARDRDIDLLE